MVPGQKIIKINGMSCGECVKVVKASLENMPGVMGADVTLDPPEALVTYDTGQIPEHALHSAIEAAGYETVKG